MILPAFLCSTLAAKSRREKAGPDGADERPLAGSGAQAPEVTEAAQSVG